MSVELFLLLLIGWKLWTPFFRLAARHPLLTLLLLFVFALPALSR